jgi:hypothetical protein
VQQQDAADGVTDMVWEALADLPLTFVEDDITGGWCAGVPEASISGVPCLHKVITNPGARSYVPLQELHTSNAHSLLACAIVGGCRSACDRESHGHLFEVL